jgi:hypothetical protein
MVTNFFYTMGKIRHQKKNTPLWHYETYQFSMETYLLDPARPVKKRKNREITGLSLKRGYERNEVKRNPACLVFRLFRCARLLKVRWREISFFSTAMHFTSCFSLQFDLHTVILFSSRNLYLQRAYALHANRQFIFSCKTCVLPLPTNRKALHICVKICAAGAPTAGVGGSNLPGYNDEMFFLLLKMVYFKRII